VKRVVRVGILSYSLTLGVKHGPSPSTLMLVDHFIDAVPQFEEVHFCYLADSFCYEWILKFAK
jgi:hypothetical protein